MGGLADGRYTIVTYDTGEGRTLSQDGAASVDGVLVAGIGPVRRDLAIAIGRLP